MLAKTPGGNMGEVYRTWCDQADDMIRCAEDAERSIQRLDARKPVVNNEIAEDATADWYLIYTFPGDDLKAMRYLARRGFGVFRPMQQRKQPHREGQPIGMMEPVFPGWLFVYCWDIDKLRSSILACPGVMGILTTRIEMTPLAVPDWFVQTLREKSWVFEERLGHVAQESARHEQRCKPRRPHKRERKMLDRLKKAVKQRGFEWDETTWDNVNALEPHERIALLERTLSPPVVG